MGYLMWEADAVRGMRIENSFIPARGVGEATERGLWRDGVVTWDDFHPRHLGGKTGARVEDFIAEASERLDDGDTAYFGETLPSGELWRLYGNVRDDAAFFDIETTGLSPHASHVTTVSVHRDGETKTFVRGQDLSGAALRESLGDASMLVSFNGKRFDQPFLEHHFDVDLDSIPHLDLMYPCRRLDLTGGLKRIECDLGLDRDGVEDVDGREAVRLWHRYERRGDEAALDRLVEYNRYDTRNLEALLQSVHRRLRADVFEPYLPERDGA